MSGTITTHAPGTFCWPELGTTDHEAARRFYGTLFGWESSDSPMGPGEIYTIFKLGGRDVAALYTLRQEQKDQGVPPHWMAYVAVENADESAKKAESLGATLIMQPFDVMEHGRMAIVRDPQGAVLCLWQAKKHAGVGVLNEVGSLVWTELATPDTAGAEKFYTSLLPWTTEKWQGPMEYTQFKRSDGSGAGGMMQLSDEMKAMGAPPNWLSYFNVADCAAFVEKAKGLGAKVLMGPETFPDVGVIGVFLDPQGAAFAVIQPAS
jgi:predicted enzyme related to lactoylglutathione lyase